MGLFDAVLRMIHS